MEKKNENFPADSQEQQQQQPQVISLKGSIRAAYRKQATTVLSLGEFKVFLEKTLSATQ